MYIFHPDRRQTAMLADRSGHEAQCRGLHQLARCKGPVGRSDFIEMWIMLYECVCCDPETVHHILCLTHPLRDPDSIPPFRSALQGSDAANAIPVALHRQPLIDGPRTSI
ncbi:unnamed protein product [Nezara viridula]|uniref:Uncharacterized protein n=1 Tax=Nezara viridula TaxID=85310 RepID=A0A9P0EFD8_NEZVI|nr:unnamed protein product [Nezara viridula]